MSEERVTVHPCQGTGCHFKQQYKVWLNTMGNPLLNWPNKDLWRNRILPHIDLFVSWEIRMTDTVRYADIVLPEATTYERYELIGDTDNCYYYCEPAIEPQGESKDPAWIWHQLANRLGITEAFPFDSLKGWVDMKAATGLSTNLGVVYDGKKAIGTETVTLDWLQKDKVIRAYIPDDVCKDAVYAHPLMTGTGRYEFYYENAVPVGQQFANYMVPYINEPQVRAEYPLQFYVARHKYFMQGQFTNVPECMELAKSQFGVALNPIEAVKRGLKDGETVEVFNQRGTMRVPLQIRDDIPVGMAHTWYSFDETFYEGNCPQDLMNAENAPEKYDPFLEIASSEVVYKYQTILRAPQNMCFISGNTTPEGLWDNVCDVRKIEEEGEVA